MSNRARLRNRLFSLWIVPLLLLQLAAGSVTTVKAAGSSEYSFANGAFRQLWEYYDLPVVGKQANRSLT